MASEYLSLYPTVTLLGDECNQAHSIFEANCIALLYRERINVTTHCIVIHPYGPAESRRDRPDARRFCTHVADSIG